MATDLETLVISLSADARAMQNALKSAQTDTDKALARIEKRFADTNKHVSESFKHLGEDFEKLIVALGIERLAEGARELSDEWTNSGNLLRAMGIRGEETANKLKELNAIAIETHAAFGETVDLYAKMTRANDQLNFTEGQRLKLIKTINEALVIGGATTAQKQSVLLDLTEAIGLGNLGGRQLRNLSQNSQILTRTIEKEFKTTAIKKLGEEGQLSIKRIFEGFLNAGKDISENFGSAITPIEAAMQNLRNKLIELTGDFQETTGAAGGLVGVITHITENLDGLAASASTVAAVLIGGVGGRALFLGLVAIEAEVGAIAAGGLAASAAMKILGGTIESLGGPLGVGLVVVGAAIAYMVSESSEATIRLRAQQKVEDELRPIQKERAELTEKLAKATGEEAAQTAKAIEQLDEYVPKQIAAKEALLARAEAALAAAEADRLANQNGNTAAIGDQSSGVEQFNVQLKSNALETLSAEIKALKNKLPTVEVEAEIKLGGSEKPFHGPVDEEVVKDFTTAHALKMAQARDDEDAIRRISDQIEIQRRMKELVKAGLTDQEASAKAAGEVNAERRAGDARANDVSAAKAQLDLWKRTQDVIDSATGSTTKARGAIADLQAAMDTGQFVGNQTAYVQTYIDHLEAIVKATGDAGAAIAELHQIEGVRTDDAIRAEYRYLAAARSFREQRDEELQRPFRADELADDLKDALHQGVAGGDWADILREKAGNALLRAANRMTDALIDQLLAAAGLFGKEMQAQTTLSGGGKSGGLVSGLIHAIGSLFGGKSAAAAPPSITSSFFDTSTFGGFRAAGGPVQAGKTYIVGEHGPEPFIPKVPGFIVPNGGGAPTIQYTDARQINFTGTSQELAEMRDAMAADLRSRRAQIEAVVRDGAARRRF